MPPTGSLGLESGDVSRSSIETPTPGEPIVLPKYPLKEIKLVLLSVPVNIAVRGDAVDEPVVAPAGSCVSCIGSKNGIPVGPTGPVSPVDPVSPVAPVNPEIQKNEDPKSLTRVLTAM
jgi:hypothetical protein